MIPVQRSSPLASTNLLGPRSLSVVIVNWNTCDLLTNCLNALERDRAQLEPDGLDVIVVDNASGDGSAQMVRERFPWVTLIANQENLRFARGNNEGIRISRGHFVVLLNSDTEVQPGALSQLVEALQAYPEAGAAGPRMLNPDGSLQSSYGALPSVWSEIIGPFLFDTFTKPWGQVGKRFLGRSLEEPDCSVVDRVSFACTMVRRKALEQVGLLDENYVFYSEDYDWFKRLNDAGWAVIFCPKAKVMHHWGKSSSQRSEWALAQLYRSKRLYYAKHYSPGTELMLRVGLSARFLGKLSLAVLAWPLQNEQSHRQIELQRHLLEVMWQPL